MMGLYPLALALASQPVVPVPVQRLFACQFRRANGSLDVISGNYTATAFASTLFDVIGDRRLMNSAANNVEPLHRNNYAWRRSWRVRAPYYPHYRVDIDEFPDGTGQIVVGRIVHEGRHSIEEFLGAGPCTISVPVGKFNTQ